MKNIVTFLVFTLSSVAVFAQASTNSYPDSGFSATFPVSVKVEKNAIDSELGKIDLTLYLAEGDDYMIMISESKYPSGIIKPEDKSKMKNMLEGAKNGALNNFAKQMQSKYESKTNEDFLFDNKYQGNKFTGSVNGIEIVGKGFIKNNQMYQILVFGNTTSEDTTTFLNSFKLIEVK